MNDLQAADKQAPKEATMEFASKAQQLMEPAEEADDGAGNTAASPKDETAEGIQALSESAPDGVRGPCIMCSMHPCTPL